MAILAYLATASITCFFIGSFFEKENDVWTLGGIGNLALAFLWSVFAIYK